MIGILGGTFDPVHFGHLGLAKDAETHLKLSQVRFVPLNQAVHKDQPGTSADLRLDMLEAAVDQPNWIIDQREITRGGASYAIDTLASLKQDFPDQTLCWIMGTDAYNGFLRWKQPENIMQYCHLVVLQRPGYQLPDDDPLRTFTHAHLCNSPDKLASQTAGKVYFMSINPKPISSSEIRQHVAKSQTIEGFCPEKVCKIIDSHRLYKDQ